MSDILNKIRRWTGSNTIEKEVEEEFRFHLDSLQDHYLNQGLAQHEASAATRNQFGQVEPPKQECIEISKRRQPVTRFLKALFVLLFVGGAFIRAGKVNLQVTRVGDVLMMVGVLGNLLMYVRSLSPANFSSGEKSLFWLRLFERSPRVVPPYDEKNRTPTERVISND
jgi:hypothetical protein